MPNSRSLLYLIAILYFLRYPRNGTIPLEAHANSGCHPFEKVVEIHAWLDDDPVPDEACRADAEAKGMGDEVVALAVDEIAERKIEIEVQGVWPGFVRIGF